MPVEESSPDTNNPRSRLRTFAILGALFLSLFLAALDATIVSTALPTIASHFHSASGYTWVGSAYLLGNAASAPIWAKISDIWGRKPILLAAVAVFFTSSIVCASSTSMAMLITGRSIQGSASGGLMVLVNICISDMFSMRERGLYLGLMEFVWALAAAIGPVLGGTFTELLSWRWNWWINLPFCGVTFLVLFLFLDVHNPKTKVVDGIKAVDWFGTFTILGLTLLLLLGLDFGGATFPWKSPKVICLIVFGALMGVFFILSETKLAKYPLMPFGLMRHRSNVASLVIGFVHGFAFIAAEYYLPLYFQSVRQASPFHSGILLLPTVITEALCGIATGLIIHRTGRYLELIYAGMGFLTLGSGLFINLTAYSPLYQVIVFQIITGIGAGLLFEPPLIALQSLVSQSDTATATATFGFIRNMATALSVVACGVVFQNGMELREPILKNQGLPTNITDLLTGSAAAANVMVISTIQDPRQVQEVKEAFAWSLRNMWIMVTGVSAFGILGSAFIGKHVLGTEHTETKTGLKVKDSLELRERDGGGT
ncbi:MAG: hypothetical protein M1812_005218 [Candelaria pacifica]|nr:MAG: hypothetical protein M1812_005218 [Candelaria pacifica]